MCHAGKELGIVDTLALLEPFRYPACFVRSGFACLSIDLACEDPFGGERFRCWMAINDFPDTVLVHLTQFILDGLLPLWPLCRAVSFAKGLWHRRGDESMCYVR